MNKLICLFLVTLFSLAAFAQEKEVRIKNFNLDKGLAIDGYDAVSYFHGKPLEGKKEFATTYEGVTYYFSSAKNKSAFITNPEKYEPAYGGWCAFAMGESGEKVKVDPETFKIIGGKIYLFYNFWGNNTREDWDVNEGQLKSSADKQWKKYVNQ